MSFNFNWEPLLYNDGSASPNEFYEKAKELLTTALNKPSKPPIIVDDIVVSDLNLGMEAPRLEVLEIGDIASDRFRGVFKMSYNGDACIKLSTKVQVNPLHTYLSTTPDFISPTPLAASSPLTIPIQITLSEFKLDGFVILVFSKSKGITIVFRNDPLESLKVTSTFDSIPYIKEYLQKEIERQVRDLFQEELPVAIHKLSLRLWNPDYVARERELRANASRSSSPTSHDVRDCFTERRDSFEEKEAEDDDEERGRISQKNVARLAYLRCSQNTLNPFTPSIPSVLYRACIGGAYDAFAPDQAITTNETGEEIPVPATPSYTAGLSVRPTTVVPGNKKKKKRRIINLRGTLSKLDTSTEGTQSSASSSRSELESPVMTESSRNASPAYTTTSPIFAPSPVPVNPPVSTPQNINLKESYFEETIRNRILEKALLAKLANEVAKQARGESSGEGGRRWSLEDLDGLVDLPQYKA